MHHFYSMGDCRTHVNLHYEQAGAVTVIVNRYIGKASWKVVQGLSDL